MQDNPSPAAILALAIEQLGAIDPGSARAKFEMRMATAALELIKRAMDLQPISDAAERDRLGALLHEDGDLQALNRRLCVLIRNGELSRSSPSLGAHLRATTMEKLAIDQPNYAAYRRALERTKG